MIPHWRTKTRECSSALTISKHVIQETGQFCYSKQSTSDEMFWNEDDDHKASVQLNDIVSGNSGRESEKFPQPQQPQNSMLRTRGHTCSWHLPFPARFTFKPPTCICVSNVCCQPSRSEYSHNVQSSSQIFPRSTLTSFSTVLRNG